MTNCTATRSRIRAGVVTDPVWLVVFVCTEVPRVPWVSERVNGTQLLFRRRPGAQSELLAGPRSQITTSPRRGDRLMPSGRRNSPALHHVDGRSCHTPPREQREPMLKVIKRPRLRIAR